MVRSPELIPLLLKNTEYQVIVIIQFILEVAKYELDHFTIEIGINKQRIDVCDKCPRGDKNIPGQVSLQIEPVIDSSIAKNSRFYFVPEFVMIDSMRYHFCSSFLLISQPKSTYKQFKGLLYNSKQIMPSATTSGSTTRIKPKQYICYL